MNSRLNVSPPYLTTQDMVIREVIIDGEKRQKCGKCPLISRRKFNMERHYKRFHDTTFQRECCGTIYNTKGDFNDHRQKVHGEKKKYAKEQNQMQDDNEVSQLLRENSNPPKKHFLHKWQRKSSALVKTENRAPLTENVNRRKAIQCEPKKRKLLNSLNSKENVKKYNITDLSEMKFIKF